MAYVDRTPSRNRTAIMIVVGAIHAAAIYGLITGLTVKIITNGTRR